MPEFVLIVAAIGIFVAGAFVSVRGTWSFVAGLAVVVAAALLARQHGAGLAEGAVLIDATAEFARWFALGLGGLLALSGAQPMGRIGKPEYVGSLLLIVAGLMIVASAADIVLLFVGLEMISIPTYILLYLGRRDAASQEATAKYFFLSILSSAVLLYGLSFLYGATGDTSLAAIRAAASLGNTIFAGEKLLSVAVVLIVAGLAFRMAAAPMHFYAPDVYQGTTHANAALLSVAPKLAGFVVLLRILFETLPGMAPLTWKIALGLSLLSMTLGNFLALWQDNIRRMMAYSSIAHTGYMLMGVAAGLAMISQSPDWNAAGAVMFYLVVYAAATVGVFAALSYLNCDGRQIDTIEELAGLGGMRPTVAAAMSVCLFSLAGLPPLAGFWGKLLLFGSVLEVGATGGVPTRQAWFIALAVVGAINAAVAAAYYLRVIATIYFRGPLATSRAQGGRGALLAAMLAALICLIVGLYAAPSIDQANRAAPIPNQQVNGEQARPLKGTYQPPSPDL